VTGTKGKTTVTEMLAAVLEAGGKKVAVSSTIHFRIGEKDLPNLYKMTLPGRGFIQKFLREAVDDGCTAAVIEVTSESALQSRHLFLYPDLLVFTNLQKEHLESHGGMENYFRAKFRIGKALANSSKRPRTIVATEDDDYGKRFLALPVENRISFSLTDATDIEHTPGGVAFSYDGVRFVLPHPGNASVVNALAAAKAGRELGVPLTKAAFALGALTRIPGRMEHIERGQDFVAVVDYAHTADSLQALYAAYPGRKICVLGNTGGGRDAWKRPLMGQIADDACDEVFLTDEDPYDEEPRAIVDAMAKGMKRVPTIIMDRRTAIAAALSRAQPGDAVLISGKGTDPYIMRAKGTKERWSDSAVVAEELDKLLEKH
jgi:UDP-N-acetylmuramoyl-L-alanyl-D-glutamate--2,6-diaminopimelate ligase